VSRAVARGALLGVLMAACARERSDRPKETAEVSGSESGSRFPGLVVQELASLDSNLTPSRWLAAHPGDTLQTYNRELTGDAGSWWCARAVLHPIAGQTTVARFAYFYLPEPSATFTLPTSVDPALLREQCHLGAIWIQSTADPPPGTIVAARIRDTLALSHGPAAETLTREVSFLGSAYWQTVGRWQSGAVSLVTAYDRSAGDTKPRLVALASYPFSHFGEPPELDEPEARAVERGHELARRAARLSQLDSALIERLLAADSAVTAAAARGSAPDARKAGQDLAVALKQWIAASRALDAMHRAAALVAADQVLGNRRLGYVLAQDSTLRGALTPLGASFAHDELGEGDDYVHSWLDQATRLDSAGPAGSLARLALLRLGFNKSGMCGGTDSASQRVSRLAEEALQSGGGADSQDIAELHLLAAQGYGDIVALAAGEGMDYADTSDYVTAAPAARLHAIEHYQRALAAGLSAADASAARRDGWRLLVGLAPVGTHFFCIYD
jgi:hypothetical protein